jgi:hypothetical protein
VYIRLVSSKNGDTDNDAHRNKQKPLYEPANIPRHAGLKAAEAPVRCLLQQPLARREESTC